MNWTQRIVGGLVLGSILVFGLRGIVVYAQAGEFRYIKDDVYIDECGACHLAYPPPLLPEQSWVSIMFGLDDHFGESAETDDDTVVHILAYLQQHALGKGRPSTMSKMLRNLTEPMPLRITQLPGFISAHDLIKEQLGIVSFDVGFLSPCADCHRQASAAIFDKELLHPGYGPKVWGGPAATQ